MFALFGAKSLRRRVAINRPRRIACEQARGEHQEGSQFERGDLENIKRHAALLQGEKCAVVSSPGHTAQTSIASLIIVAELPDMGKGRNDATEPTNRFIVRLK
jgi:hypothetical protein